MNIFVYSVNLLDIKEEQRIGQDEELHLAGQGPTPVGAHVAMVEEILYEEQIAPPVCGTHLVEALVNVIN